MDNFVLMHVFQTNKQIANKKFSLLLVESSFVAQMISQITPVQIIHDQVEVLPILKSIANVDQKWMVEPTQKLSLVHHRTHWLFVNNFHLTHLLHSKHRLTLFHFHLPHLTEASLADRIEHVQKLFAHLLYLHLWWRVGLTAFSSKRDFVHLKKWVFFSLLFSLPQPRTKALGRIRIFSLGIW